MDQQYVIEIKVNKSIHIKIRKVCSVMINCLSNHEHGDAPMRLIPSNMSLDLLFNAAKAEHMKTVC